MKQTLNTHVCSLAKEGAAVYSLARGKAAAVTSTQESGEAAASSLAQKGKTRYPAPDAPPKHRVSTNY